ncbi:hypothetical protein HanPI659440_Chr07g0261201 [Helianthus annuus]|nr:hypothetical protein HanPI659440_Chr07g0261201 [Helianthus annuus]
MLKTFGNTNASVIVKLERYGAQTLKTSKPFIEHSCKVMSFKFTHLEKRLRFFSIPSPNWMHVRLRVSKAGRSKAEFGVQLLQLENGLTRARCLRVRETKRHSGSS